MGRSYLYPGRDTEALTPAERQLEKLYDRIDTPSNRLTATQFFQTPEASQLLDQLYGGLNDRLPPGSQIISQTPGKITYRDPEGYEHNLIRKPDGQFQETTNRPPILPNKAQEDFIAQLQQRVQQNLGQPLTLAELDPATAQSLQAQSQAEQAAIDQQLADAEAQILARLFGNRVNQSSIATNAGARFAQQGGLIRQQQRADAAGRELAVRNFLTTLGAQQRELETGLYSNLAGQGLQRDIAGAGLTLDRARLDEQSRQFSAANYLDQLRTQQEQEKLDLQRGPLAKFLGITQGVGNIIGAVGGGLGAYKALTGGK